MAKSGPSICETLRSHRETRTVCAVPTALDADRCVSGRDHRADESCAQGQTRTATWGIFSPHCRVAKTARTNTKSIERRADASLMHQSSGLGRVHSEHVATRNLGPRRTARLLKNPDLEPFAIHASEATLANAQNAASRSRPGSIGFPAGLELAHEHQVARVAPDPLQVRVAREIRVAGPAGIGRLAQPAQGRLCLAEQRIR